MAKLYADEDFSYPVAEELRQLGHDVITAQQAGQANQGVVDSLVLAFAAAAGRALLTFNRRHFIQLHRSSPSHAGVIVCTRDPDTVALAKRIHLAIVGASSLIGQLLRINRSP
jgi:Domain of unknown function (DUF5615)